MINDGVVGIDRQYWREESLELHNTNEFLNSFLNNLIYKLVYIIFFFNTVAFFYSRSLNVLKILKQNLLQMKRQHSLKNMKRNEYIYM